MYRVLVMFSCDCVIYVTNTWQTKAELDPDTYLTTHSIEPGHSWHGHIFQAFVSYNFYISMIEKYTFWLHFAKWRVCMHTHSFWETCGSLKMQQRKVVQTWKHCTCQSDGSVWLHSAAFTVWHNQFWDQNLLSAWIK